MSRFVNILFLIFAKENKRKNFVSFFKICKDIFLISEKWDERKSCAMIWKKTFLIFEKGDK